MTGPDIPEPDPVELDAVELDLAEPDAAAVELERHFRRLLLAYPSDYRERRAEEMLATLLDDAAAGQRQPTRDEVVDLLVGGVRQRLRLPNRPGMVIAAVLAAFILGAFAGCGAGLIGWIGTGPLADAVLDPDIGLGGAAVDRIHVPGPASVGAGRDDLRDRGGRVVHARVG